jgi:hypothetical protein
MADAVKARLREYYSATAQSDVDAACGFIDAVRD